MKKTQLDGHGRARREASRRRKSECKIQEDEIPLAIMAGRMKKFSEITSTIPEVMDSSTLNFKANFKFSRFFGGEGRPPSGVCYKPLSISSVCENFRAQHPLGA